MMPSLQEQNNKRRITRMARIKNGTLHQELSGQIIGAAMQVLNELKPGLDEKLDERALVIELNRRGHSVNAQRSYPVFYRSALIGHLLPDLLVDDTVIVDPNVVSTLNETDVAQMIGYLAISKLHLALLLNFKTARLEWKRVVRQDGKDSNGPDLRAQGLLSATSA
jgi:GxxExxY protein